MNLLNVSGDPNFWGLAQKNLPRENYVSAETICLALNLGFFLVVWGFGFFCGRKRRGFKEGLAQ